MKIREDFVTNSSSSNYIIAYKKPEIDRETMEKYPFLKVYIDLVEDMLREEAERFCWESVFACTTEVDWQAHLFCARKLCEMERALQENCNEDGVLRYRELFRCLHEGKPLGEQSVLLERFIERCMTEEAQGYWEKIKRKCMDDPEEKKVYQQVASCLQKGYTVFDKEIDRNNTCCAEMVWKLQGAMPAYFQLLHEEVN